MPSVNRFLASYRFRAIIVLLGVIALLGLAVYLDPVRLEKFNSGYPLLHPCGFLISTGYPCPTCFMTRAFVYMMHGRPDKAFLAQPFGAVLCLVVIYLGVGAIRVLITDQPWRPFWIRWRTAYVLGAFALLFVASWTFKLVYGTYIVHEFPLR